HFPAAVFLRFSSFEGISSTTGYRTREFSSCCSSFLLVRSHSFGTLFRSTSAGGGAERSVALRAFRQVITLIPKCFAMSTWDVPCAANSPPPGAGSRSQLPVTFCHFTCSHATKHD